MFLQVYPYGKRQVCGCQSARRHCHVDRSARTDRREYSSDAKICLCLAERCPVGKGGSYCQVSHVTGEDLLPTLLYMFVVIILRLLQKDDDISDSAVDRMYQALLPQMGNYVVGLSLETMFYLIYNRLLGYLSL